MTPNPERRNPQRLARDAERAQQVAASLAQIADDVARVVGIDEARGEDVGCKVTATQAPDGSLVIESVEYSRGLAPDAGTDELDALDLEGASMLMHDFLRPMGVRS